MKMDCRFSITFFDLLGATVQLSNLLIDMNKQYYVVHTNTTFNLKKLCPSNLQISGNGKKIFCARRLSPKPQAPASLHLYACVE
jgi:hypothetical protein